MSASQMLSGEATANTTPTETSGEVHVTDTTTGTSTSNAGSTDWTSSLNDDLKGYVQNKGFKDVVTALESYRNLEKLIGVPQEQILKLPKDDDAEAMAKIYNKLGRPEKADGYEIKTGEGLDEKFAEWAKGTFHELGLTKKQAEALASKMGEFNASQSKASETDYATQVQAEEQGLKKEWGAAFDQNLGTARRAAQEFGMDAATIDKLEGAMGFQGVMKFLHNLGSKVGEDSFVSGDRNTGFGAMAPAQAQNRIQSLMGDPDFSAKYISGDIKAREEMARLHQFAYGG